MNGDETAQSGRVRRNVRLLLEYEGTAFFGSQRQARGRTVQEELETAFQRVTGQPVTITLAGRTDTGVHATGQVANFRLETAQDEAFFRRAPNAVLPPDVRILTAAFVPWDFHARFAARERHYRYTLVNGPVLPPLWRQVAAHIRRPLDLALISEATASLVGERDFASFCGAGKGIPAREEEEPTGANRRPRLPTVRRITRAEWVTTPLDRGEGSLWQFTIAADGFLPHMVRNIVGTLSEVGLGKISPAAFREIIAAADRRRAGPTAPAQGLCLTHVYY